MDDIFIEITEENIRLFTPLFVSVFNSSPWNDGWSLSSAEERLVAFSQFPQFKGLGLLCDNEPVALVIGWGECWVDGWSFYVKEMCVSQNRQNSGIGGKLLSELESRLRLLDYVSVYLHTGSKAPARSFYEKHGYGIEDYISLGKVLRT